MKRLLNDSIFRFIFITDAIILVAGYLFSYLIRFDFHVPVEYFIIFKKSVIAIVLLKLAIFYLSKLYNVIWQYTGMVDLRNTIKANIIASVIITAVFLIINLFSKYSGIIIIDCLISIIFIGGSRVLVRLIYGDINKKEHSKNTKADNNIKKRVVIIGAGEAGEKIIREFRDNPRFNYSVIGFIDDDPKKRGLNIHGLLVIGSIEDLENIVKNYKIEDAIIAVPSATGKQMRRIVEKCKECSLNFMTIPSIEDIIRGKVAISRLRNVTYEDLLGRNSVVLEIPRIETCLKNKRILITGAGGSIGSELCREISRFNPALLVLCDNSENNLFQIDLNLRREFPSLNLISVLSDIKNFSHMENIFKKYSPEVVFHAAAYKHVPMMELNPWEAVHNNIIGTKNILLISGENNIERFVMVSTDKAVRPCNIMGASKRIAEMLTQAYALKFRSTRFVTVRFGNVIGSRGSVIPLFKEQIERGGPVTVTHPEVTRYFMTISEATQLILQAAAMGEGREIFILNMGTPIKMADMARDLIKLSGLEPGEDIEIKFTGLRPGEKLYEELITEGEGIIKTHHEKIMVLKGDEDFKLDYINGLIAELVKSSMKYDSENIRKKIKELVNEYNYTNY
ncbi:MAG: nucleoside-diphosphate sugar epimerase/dehydratase [bacterium]|nr:nucleoside-diphosphate sugar epimerase/dehydratase [bacterium]